MLMRIELTLPRDARYVGVLREMAGCALASLRVESGEVADVQLALTEACANAVRHAVGTSAYRVRLDIEQERCRVEVTDVGPGIPAGPGTAAALSGPRGEESDAESGRGLQLMRGLMDDLEVLPGAGGRGATIVLTKRWTGSAGLTAASDEPDISGLPS